MNQEQTVFVGLSGGVDSSVAALRLKKQGFNVVGVFIKVWHPNFMPCNWEGERLDAMRVAAHLNIPFLTCDAEREYLDDVAKYFISEYKAGRTPNPDVMCNQHVKFGAFLRFAKSRGADFIATGHYAQRVESEKGLELHRGIDDNKDQTYFLWTLSKEQLEATLFPIGNTSKDKIRTEADVARIPTAQKKDSQGICFLGHVDIPEFLSHYIELVPGPVLDDENNVIGRHVGTLVYTIGQRHGFTLDTQNTERQAMYVVHKDSINNTITVSSKKPTLNSLELITLENFVLRQLIKPGDTFEAQARYRQTAFEVCVVNIDNSQLCLESREKTEQPAVGQSCVLYRGTECIGGGIVV
ncbi:MAG: tRNA-specific 2-thiouridylase [Candidatus Paceibacteria bacterium]|jgi:tRNA-specific 2-thiouridylase